MIQGLLFDFGGTLDSDGGHWLDRFGLIYDQIGLSHIPKNLIKEAFYHADRIAEDTPAMKTAGFRDMMDLHVGWQFSALDLHDPEKAQLAASLFYRHSERILHRNRRVLEELSLQGMKMGVISNFYGNVARLCHEAGLSPYLKTILDSQVVGVRKPDPVIFQKGLDALRLPPHRVGFVGDSFERDMEPAKALGMTTFWIIGDQKRRAPKPGIVDHTIYSLEDLPGKIPK